VNGCFAKFLPTLLVLGLSTACTSTSDVRSMTETRNSEYVPLKEEQWAIEQADLYHREFVEQGLLYADITLKTRLDRMESRLLSTQPEIRAAIQLFVLRSPALNAFAMPNGNIYVHAGLFTALQSEDQLAAIVSHEIAHVTQRHSVKAVISNKNKLIGSHIVDFATGGFGVVYFGTYASIMDFSREQEAEADAVGFSLLVDSGYQPQAMLEIFKSLGNYPELKHVKNSIYSSHPSYQSRIRALQTMVAEKRGTGDFGEIQDDEFVAIKSRMMEDSLKTRLRNREYNLALTIINDADEFFADAVKVNFYRGEVHHGFAQFPEIAAREYYWIQTGKDKADKATEEKFIRERTDNLDAAIRYYELSVQAVPPYAKSFRRLGEIAEGQGRTEQALGYFTQYLEHSPDAMDRLYIELAMKRLREQAGDSP
jgi:hypothetical protein